MLRTIFENLLVVVLRMHDRLWLAILLVQDRDVAVDSERCRWRQRWCVDRGYRGEPHHELRTDLDLRPE